MKLNEFKAWFEGYTEAMEGAPSKKQWERIKEQVAAVDGVAITPTSYPVYIDRYVRPWYPHWSYFGAGNVSSAVGSSAQSYNTTAASSAYSKTIEGVATTHPGVPAFDGAAAMYEAGKAEAAAH